MSQGPSRLFWKTFATLFPTQLTAPGSLRMALFKYQHTGTVIWGFVLFFLVDVITLSDEEEVIGMFLLLN